MVMRFDWPGGRRYGSRWGRPDCDSLCYRAESRWLTLGAVWSLGVPVVMRIQVGSISRSLHSAFPRVHANAPQCSRDPEEMEFTDTLGRGSADDALALIPASARSAPNCYTFCRGSELMPLSQFDPFQRRLLMVPPRAMLRGRLVYRTPGPSRVAYHVFGVAWPGGVAFGH